MIPFLRSSNPWFAFLVHLRGLEDADRVGLGSFLRAYSDDAKDFERKLETLPPVVSSEVRFRSSAAYGEIVCINRLPGTMVLPKSRQDVLEAAQLAVKRGSKVIGLGALTSPATGGGMTIVRDLPSNITVTSGNSLTAAIVRANVLSASQYLCGSKTSGVRVAIVGCTGSVGAAATRLLANDGFNLILVGRNQQRVQREFPEISNAVYSGDVSSVRDADLIVALTNDPGAMITPDLPQENSIVIDCAQPLNVPPSSYCAFRQRGIAVVEGGMVRIPDYSCTDSFGFTCRTDTFSCLAETYLFARCAIREHSVGRCTIEQSLRMQRLASQYGILPRPLDFSLPVPNEKVELNAIAAQAASIS
jgi:fatty aldehyde-generating acyl-ACP reductase